MALQRGRGERHHRLAQYQDVPETGDEQKSQGWTPFIFDTNGNGKRDDYVEPDQPVDPAKDKRIVAGYYGIGFNPDGRFDLGLGAELSRRRGASQPR